jgi:hypothetical protein
MAKDLIITDEHNEYGFRKGAGTFLDEAADRLIAAGHAIADTIIHKDDIKKPISKTVKTKTPAKPKPKINSPKKAKK